MGDISVLMVDQAAYLEMYNSLNGAQQSEINGLYNKLTKMNGALWLVSGLEQRAAKLANDAYKEIKKETTNETIKN